MTKIVTSFVYPPIPDRRFDWSATYDDYDGAEDSGSRGEIGYGATETEAVADLIESFPRDEEADRPTIDERDDHSAFRCDPRAFMR